jgi:hyperosmotically inducible periplasmic protein
MFRALFRLVLLLVILVAVAGFFLGWWDTGRVAGGSSERAREVGAEVGDRAAAAASQARETLEDGALTAKIKSKMALDDTIKASRINVDTTDQVVTLTGGVDSEAQRQRAVQLARETNGVRNVVDRLTVGARQAP